MPRIIEYTENEGSAQSSASTLINLINQSKSSTAGFAGFQIKTIVVSSVSAVIFGQASAMLITSLVGPGISFLAGAGFGFIGGIVHRWRTDVREAKDAFREHPDLMEYHLRQTCPECLKKQSFDEWIQTLGSSPARQGHAIGALYSASIALGRIREMQEESIIEAEGSRYSSAE